MAKKKSFDEGLDPFADVSGPSPAIDPQLSQRTRNSQPLPLDPFGGEERNVSPLVSRAPSIPPSSHRVQPARVVTPAKDTRKRPKVPPFRCIPTKLKEEVNQAAFEWEMPVGLFARYLVELGLEHYQRGEITLNAQITPSGWTLYPQEKSDSRVGRPPKGSKPRKMKKEYSQVAFRGVTTWHRDQLKKIATDGHVSVPVGEILRALLEHGMDLYRRGLLPPIPRKIVDEFYQEFGSSDNDTQDSHRDAVF